MIIDTTLNMEEQVQKNRDPDTFCHLLHRYHRFLWRKKLPNGEVFELIESSSPPYYFHHSCKEGNYKISSDAIIHTYSRWKKMEPIINEIGETDIRTFRYQASTIGGYILFPAGQIARKPTINAIRGMHPHISDRFDYTLECIRLWYRSIKNPLFDHLERYRYWFELFVDFKGYVDFFLLNDLVTEDNQNIRFWLPFEGFGSKSPTPINKAEYLQ